MDLYSYMYGYEVPKHYMGLFMYKASYIYGSILCTVPPILHKMVPYICVIRTIMGPSYAATLIMWSLTLVHKMVPYICSVICNIMGQVYMHVLL